ncbi:M24 family metallopeptidase [Patescibacteria group bacterium]
MKLENFLKKRINNLQKRLKKEKIQYLLVTNSKNITYLTGYCPDGSSREVYLIFSEKKSYLFTFKLFEINVKNLHPLYKITCLSKDNTLSSCIKRILDSDSIWIEKNDLKVSEFEDIKNKINSKVHYSPKIIEELRQKKDDIEIVNLKKACQITKKTWNQIKQSIRPGKTEKEIQSHIISVLYKNGADGISVDFSPIVATGINSASPHHKPTNKKIKTNDVVLIDFGCQVSGYCSDMTRTLKLGEKSKEFDSIESIVKRAYEKAFLNLDNNISTDERVFKILEKHDLEKNMLHSTGHGIGLSVHESPAISRKSNEKIKIENNMIFTIEPGIYLQNKFGYRYENTIAKIKDEYVELT